MSDSRAHKAEELQKRTASRFPCRPIPAQKLPSKEQTSPRLSFVIYRMRGGSTWGLICGVVLRIQLRQLRYLAQRLVHGKHPISVGYYQIVIQYKKESVAVKRRKGMEMISFPNFTPSPPCPPHLPGLTSPLLGLAQPRLYLQLMTRPNQEQCQWSSKTAGCEGRGPASKPVSAT